MHQPSLSLITVAAGLGCQFTPTLSARTFLGVAGYREYDIRRSERRFAREDPDPALTLGFNAILRF